MSFSRVRLAVAVSALASIAAAVPVAAQPAPIDLGTLGGTRTHAAAINNRQQIAGSSTLAGSAETHAFLWERGVMHDLGGRWSAASAINDRGQIVGTAADLATGEQLTMLWEQARPPCCRRWPARSAAIRPGSTSTASSSAGVPCPWRTGSSPRASWCAGSTASSSSCCRWTSRRFHRDQRSGRHHRLRVLSTRTDLFFFFWQDGVLSRVDQLAGQHFEDVTGLNTHGDLTGYRLAPQGAQAIVWDGRTIVVLPGLPGAGSSFASGINDHGEVAGVSAGGIDHNFPVVWTHKGIIVLGTIPAQFIQPTAINDRGDVIGEARLSSESVTGLLWPATSRRR